MDEIKLVVFDFNKTLVEENTWYNLNMAMGVTEEEDQTYLKSFESGKITYDEWWNFIEGIYHERGNPTRENIMKAISDYHYVDGAKDLVKYLKTKGYHLALITGALDLLAEKVAHELDIDMYAAHNQFLFTPDHMLKKVVSHGYDHDFKVDMLWKFCNELDIPVTQAACVGDGDNDTGIFAESQHGITFKGSRVEDRAWKVIEKLEDIKTFL